MKGSARPGRVGCHTEPRMRFATCIVLALLCVAYDGGATAGALMPWQLSIAHAAVGPERVVPVAAPRTCAPADELRAPYAFSTLRVSARSRQCLLRSTCATKPGRTHLSLRSTKLSDSTLM